MPKIRILNISKMLAAGVLALSATIAGASDLPPASAFRVGQSVPKGPSITPFLRYQTEMAWRQDEERRKRWENIRSEQELLQLQQDLRERFLNMIGGLPTEKAPLNPKITGRIPMKGCHIEKLIFESLPGVYVTALVYVPEDGNKTHPAILVASGHAANGKVHYASVCQHLVQRGYVVINWDPVGEGERSQFWDKKRNKSRYNLICAEHAVMGNLAYLAGANLARWEIWDGIRALDYLLTRPDVDAERINITGTSGGGTQAAYIAALDQRIKAAAISCYITALPMRVYNRIFQDPDSDPEQDLYGMIAKGIDHPGLLMMMYPRPVFVAAAVQDFFPIEGTHKTFHEVADLYSRFGHPDRIAMHEGYHGHEFSAENQEVAIRFLDHFNGMPVRYGLAAVTDLDERTLQTSRTGQVMLDYENARSLMDLIRDYYEERKGQTTADLKELYYSELYPGIKSWSVAQYEGAVVGSDEIRWEAAGSSKVEGIYIDRYLLRHSQYLEMPLLYVHQGQDQGRRPILLWLGENGKITASDWARVKKQIAAGYDIVSFDPRGLGETRMRYKTASPDDPALAEAEGNRANPLSSVIADYVYNSLLTGRPYLLQMIEDVEIATRFVQAKVNDRAEFSITGDGEAVTLASAVAETLPEIRLIAQPGNEPLRWSDLVKGKRELWPIQFLLPGGAYAN